MEGVTWAWTRRLAAGLSASCAGFAAFSFVAPFLPETVQVSGVDVPLTGLLAALLLAAIVACSQGLANCMGANARRVSAAGHKTAGRLCWALCLGFAAVAWLGLHNAWQSTREFAATYAFPPDIVMDGLFAFIAFAEPSLNWTVDLLKGVQKQAEDDEIAAARAAAAEREKVHALRPTKPLLVGGGGNTDKRTMTTMAAAGTAAALAVAPFAGADLPDRAAENPLGSQVADANANAAAHASHGWSGPRDQRRWQLFVEAHELGLSGAEIVRETGIPRTTVYRWRSVMLSTATRDDSV